MVQSTKKIIFFCTDEVINSNFIISMGMTDIFGFSRGIHEIGSNIFVPCEVVDEVSLKETIIEKLPPKAKHA